MFRQPSLRSRRSDRRSSAPLRLLAAAVEMWDDVYAVGRVCLLPSWIFGPEGPPRPPLFDVRCPRCRDYFPCGQEHVCMPLPTMDDRTKLSQSSASAAGPGQTFAAFPELWAFLTTTSLPEGSSRLPGKLSIALEQGMWKVTLNDGTTGLYAPLMGENLDDCLMMVEDRLAKGTMPWAVSRFASKQPKKKG